MKTLILLFALCFSGSAIAEPLATGTVTGIPKSGSFWLRFKVSKEAAPGLRFYPNVRFVLDDGTWIDGHLGCFPDGASTGEESGGEISMWGRTTLPADRTIKHVSVVAAVGDPRASFFGVKPGEVFQRLDDRVLKELEKEGGVILHFPCEKAEPRAVGDSGRDR